MISRDQVTVSKKQLDRIFPDHPNVDKSKLLVTNVALYSVSKVQAATKLVHLIKKYLNTDDITVTDATSNVGSDTIVLGKFFKQVHGIELDDDQFPILKHNVDLYELKNITLHHGDSLNIIPTLKQDVIFIDAPWTGPSYKDHATMKLYMSGKELVEVYNEFNKYAKLIIFKVPKNYDFNTFIQLSHMHKISIHAYMNYNNEIKFYFIVCYNIN